VRELCQQAMWQLKQATGNGDSLVDAPHPNVLGRSIITFDPSPLLEEEEEYSLLAPDNKAELMRWHDRLGHVASTKL
jgi:hypothetical protein